jgi:ribonuclease HI
LFLDKNSDEFTWRTSNLTGVSRDIIEHKLEVNPSARPKEHMLHKMSDEKITAVKAEVQRLLDASFIREVYYPSWLANVVMVKKKNDKWRMCTDFIDLNKCCLKDDFLLTRIDKIVDSVAGCEIMALLDCFSGYHQIWFREEDQEKMSFIMPFGTYYYLRMPEGLKNVGPTFCRMTKVILKEQLETSVFSYVDDIVVASRKKKTQLQDFAKTFATMRKAQLKLNPEKCVFGVSRGKVLGCLVSVKGMEANPDKIKAIVCMKPL